MPRKNSRVGRSNDRGRIARQKHSELKTTLSKRLRLDPDRIVVPDGQCSFMARRPKARFATEAKAKIALAQAQKNRERMGSGNVERRYYACPEGGCSGYHLTSRSEYEERP